MKLLFLLSLSFFVLLVASVDPDELLFKEFIGKYGREYANNEEYDFRFQAFKQNKEFIERHNAKQDRTHDVGFNHFADFTREEYLAKLTAKPSPCFQSSLNEVGVPIPTNLDWRSTNNVPPVENEGQCGSVAYVNVANQVSSVLSIAVNKPPVPLSSQQMIDCYTSGFDNGCNGGDPWDLYLYIEKNGLEPESAYPYSGANSTGKCHYNKAKVVASITGTGNVTNENDMKTAVATYGPTVALIDAASQEFQLYTSGIFYTTDCSAQDIDHVLLLVGYGVSNNTNYWIAQNVWGPDWGMNGYVNILRGKNTCGIATCSTYVTGAHPVPSI